MFDKLARLRGEPANEYIHRVKVVEPVRPMVLPARSVVVFDDNFAPEPFEDYWFYSTTVIL